MTLLFYLDWHSVFPVLLVLCCPLFLFLVFFTPRAIKNIRAKARREQIAEHTWASVKFDNEPEQYCSIAKLVEEIENYLVDSEDADIKPVTITIKFGH